MSPFLRRAQDERLRRNRRRRRARILPLLAFLISASGVAGLVYGTRWFLLHSSRFDVAAVAVSTTVHAPKADLVRIASRVRGRNIFTLDLDRLEQDLASVRWVERASIKRVLPDQLYCSIVEKKPRGLALLRGHVQLIDSDGRPIDLYTGSGEFSSLPILTGLDEAHPQAVKDQVARGFDFLRFLDEKHPGLAAEISEIDLGRADRIALTLNGGGPVVRLHPSVYDTNLDRFLEMRDWITQHLGSGAYVDLRFHDRIAWQPSAARTGT
ncbi:MAG TPA: FtsQ-type POTRA domain-containing protein [Candidatus Polarisedimenticolia bacterium]|nr:FtsQ-type POTRA domain-containing protein [Candidatus Polarisedimenticolia bacterium]